MSGLEWKIAEQSNNVVEQAAEWILQQAEEAIRLRGRFTLAVSGGSTPEPVYRLLAQSSAEWSRWEIYYGDERCLPEGHTDRNSRMVERSWLGKINFPEENHFPIPAEMGAARAAHCYECAVKAGQPFDLVFLGIGEDGHTASLFPGLMEISPKSVVAVEGAPKPPSERVSLGLPVIRNARQRAVIVTGSGKQQAVAAWKRGDNLPITAATACGAVVFADEAACAG